MRKVDDGKRKKKEKRKENNGVFSGHYVIASSLPPERLRPNDDRWNAARSCQNQIYRFPDSEKDKVLPNTSRNTDYNLLFSDK